MLCFLYEGCVHETTFWVCTLCVCVCVGRRIDVTDGNTFFQSQNQNIYYQEMIICSTSHK